MAGLVLDPWEAFVLEQALSERPDGRWAAFEVGLVVPRQNGKGSVIEAAELAWLFLLKDRLVIHSAHQFDTSKNHFDRVLELIEGTPEFDRRVRRVLRSHGEEGIELKGGQRIRFRTRTKGGGRGFTGDKVVLDEAMILPEATVGALMPTMSARSVTGNPQLWYAGSSVDQFVHPDGVVLARLRERALKGDDPSLAYFEWSVPANHPDEVTPETAVDQAAWGQANPGLGIRISAEHIANEQRSMDPRTFAVERLGAGDWPDLTGEEGSVIPVQLWLERTDHESRPLDPVCFAVDVSPDRVWASISASGKRADGAGHVEVVDRRRGTGWVVERLTGLIAKHQALGVVVDERGPASSLLAELDDTLGCEVRRVNSTEYAQACGLFFDAVEQGTVRHLGTPELVAAVKGATNRPLGEQWAWSRKNSTVDITPLVAATLAHWGTFASGMRPASDPVVVWA